ncbi:MAG: molybdate ABC transporter substrate-binding protein [Desulfatibacillaceae bacterium]
MNRKELPTIPADREDDLHNLEIINSADLILFMAGNQFMVMEDLIEAFQEKHPDVIQIYYQTLPPGLQLKQILAGGAVFRGKFLGVYPDVYTSVSENAMDMLSEAGHIEKGEYRQYLRNRLTLMVSPGNPKNIRWVRDLARDDVRVSQPDPDNEDIGLYIQDMYAAAGGEELVYRIMEEKRAEATTMYTVVHHRETPLRIAKKTVDAGPVWSTEVMHAQARGLAFDVVEPGEDLDQRDKVRYYACSLKYAPNPDNAWKFLEFLTTPEAATVYRRYGFLPNGE